MGGEGGRRWEGREGKSPAESQARNWGRASAADVLPRPPERESAHELTAPQRVQKSEQEGLTEVICPDPGVPAKGNDLPHCTV